MTRVRIPLAQTLGKGRSNAPGMQSLTNMYAEPVEAEGRTNMVCYGSPGTTLFSTIGAGSASVRGQLTADAVHYAVVGSRLYSVSSTGVETDRGQIIGTGLVDMSFNGTNLDIVTDQNGYSFLPSAATLTPITDVDLGKPVSVAALGGYSVFAIDGGGRFQWSTHLDSTTFDALDFATAEAEADSLTAIRKVGNELVLLGSNTIEWWYLTGDTDNLFARAPVPAADIGCTSRDTAIAVDGGLTWVGRDGKAGGVSVYRDSGHDPKRISTPEIDTLLEGVDDLTLLNAFPYQQRGHLFYVLNNPNEWSVKWDVATGQWTYQKSGGWPMSETALGGWNAFTFAMNGTTQVVGSSDGNLYSLEADTLTENSASIGREATLPQIHKDGRRCFMSRLELDIEAGVGPESGSNPTVMASWSDDGGKTWSSPRNASMGATGQNKWRAVWNACGSFRQRIIRLRVTDAVKVVMLGCWADMTIGAH